MVCQNPSLNGRFTTISKRIAVIATIIYSNIPNKLIMLKTNSLLQPPVTTSQQLNSLVHLRVIAFGRWQLWHGGGEVLPSCIQMGWSKKQVPPNCTESITTYIYIYIHVYIQIPSAHFPTNTFFSPYIVWILGLYIVPKYLPEAKKKQQEDGLPLWFRVISTKKWRFKSVIGPLGVPSYGLVISGLENPMKIHGQGMQNGHAFLPPKDHHRTWRCRRGCHCLRWKTNGTFLDDVPVDL